MATWTNPYPRQHVLTSESGRRVTVHQISDVGGKRNYSVRRDGFVDTLVGYNETLEEAKLRAEKEMAQKEA